METEGNQTTRNNKQQPVVTAVVSVELSLHREKISTTANYGVQFGYHVTRTTSTVVTTDPDKNEP